jgi:hypothetical protein
MSVIRRTLKRTCLPVLIVLCLAALTVSYAYADGALRPLATQIIGDPDAAVTGKLAVGTASPGNKALTVVGVIDFLGAGTVHNYFTQGGGNNMQVNTNVDEANAVVDATKSQWKLVMGSSLDWFSIRRSPAGATYNEDALFFIQGSTGNVGIAKVDTGNNGPIPFTPGGRLHVHATSGTSVYGTLGSSYLGNPGYGVALMGESDVPGSDAVYGRNGATTGSSWGVHGDSSSTSGVGVSGYALAATGTAYGVKGFAYSTSGIGVGGFATASTGSTFGVYGTSNSPGGVAVGGRGQATTGESIGVLGASASTVGWGVNGIAESTTGVNSGVFGRTLSTAGIGVQGYAGATTGTNYGVLGGSESPDGMGVYGYADGSNAIGVYGYNPGSWAGYFNGNVGINGYLYKYGGGFRIDHPLDPANKYLSHSFVESPDMKNVYDGVATLDENGEAWIQLPEWFEALNRDFRYQLTPIGQFAPLYIAQGIQDNRFLIAGGQAGLEVSWQVTGIRHDAYAEAHPILVEEDKPTTGPSVAESVPAPAEAVIAMPVGTQEGDKH